MEPTNPLSNPMPEEQPAKEPKGKISPVVIIIAVLAVVIVAVIAIMLSMQSKPQTNGGGTEDKTANKLYEALGNGAKQPKLHVAMFRQTFAKKADADSGQNVGSTQSSVSQLDTTKNTYENVYVIEVSGTGKGYNMGRCVGGKSYGITDREADTVTTLSAAIDRVMKPLTLDIPGSVTDSCLALGLPVGATADLAYARLNDGVFPVTLQPKEADNWTQKMKTGGLFAVKDEGMVERDGKQLRKYSFVPKNANEANDINSKLYDYFIEAAEIEKFKQENPKALYQHGFITINPGMTGGVQGFYLIDEQTNLPVYSELQGINRDRDGDVTSTAGRNIAHTKQTYDFVVSGKIDMTTPLAITK